MSGAAYRRGSRLVIRAADEQASVATRRADSHAPDGESLTIAGLVCQVARLEHELKRARRCLRAERAGREALRLRLEQADADFRIAVAALSKAAFGGAS